MNKKGFTLIELIGVIVLIALMALIIIPNVTKSLKEGSNKADAQVRENIVLAAKNWGTDNRDKLPKESGKTTKVTLDTLKAGGYIDSTITNPSTKEEITTFCVNIENKNNVYYYTANESCS